MKKELQEALVRDFPELYEQFGWSPQQTCMCWGFEVPDEWEPPIRKLSEGLTRLNRKEAVSRFFENVFCWVTRACYRVQPIQAEQVKVKFGGLRFYTSRCTRDSELLIGQAERECEAVSGDKYVY